MELPKRTHGQSLSTWRWLDKVGIEWYSSDALKSIDIEIEHFIDFVSDLLWQPASVEFLCK